MPFRHSNIAKGNRDGREYPQDVRSPLSGTANPPSTRVRENGSNRRHLPSETIADVYVRERSPRTVPEIGQNTHVRENGAQHNRWAGDEVDGPHYDMISRHHSASLQDPPVNRKSQKTAVLREKERQYPSLEDRARSLTKSVLEMDYLAFAKQVNADLTLINEKEVLCILRVDKWSAADGREDRRRDACVRTIVLLSICQTLSYSSATYFLKCLITGNGDLVLREFKRACAREEKVLPSRVPIESRDIQHAVQTDSQRSSKYRNGDKADDRGLKQRLR
jgi:hypothetical protein